ncbi:TauD/TfdA family dioxygenase [Sandaracinobacter sp. RS1-74]|uniref:TauD/TfdA dioxygenase family protein n=1 Tax=Sandaracinobacteroides sayramensis TaxID=2913411 RepID=UPI001EDA0560|nr:TauD/TfdA family dioxygenase [Sandaracinobacteroides sayramensis]MCG2842125.1 TauD/TfdA family dioxygenase [Sandaracinobacteroides sayramensis]
MRIEPSGQACGAFVTGLNLARPLPGGTIADLRQAWLEHHVLVFPHQHLSDEDLERFTLYFGGFGQDPFIAPIPGRRHIIAVERKAGEKSPLFAENWHSDWSFQLRPPAGTCLYGLTIPPTGGDTLFANQHLALEVMPDRLRKRIEGLQAIHSARAAYAPDGLYGTHDAADRSMTIRPSAEALETQLHHFVRAHPETRRLGLFGCLGYIIGFEGMAAAEAWPLLQELYEWQGQEAFRYRHRWQPGMLVMWDNRSLLHAATGGYEGHDRLLHRTTIAAS